MRWLAGPVAGVIYLCLVVVSPFLAGVIVTTFGVTTNGGVITVLSLVFLGWIVVFLTGYIVHRFVWHLLCN